MAREINYSMCWEDPDLVIRGLKISSSDSILSIASGGENIFALLLKKPKRLVAIDSNENQLRLLKLKAAAIKRLDYDSFFSFMGFDLARNRWKLFSMIQDELSEDERDYWRKHKTMIEAGIIHCGKLEMYLSLFRKTVLRLTLNRTKIRTFLSLNSIAEQQKFFNTYWNRWFWKSLFHIFFSRLLLKSGRDESYFDYNTLPNVGKHYYARSTYGITQIPVAENYFMHMILSGSIPKYMSKHPYLDETNFRKLKNAVSKIEYVHDDVSSHLGKNKFKYTKLNLSDIFERLSQKEYEEVLKKLTSFLKPGTRICYWNNMVIRKKSLKQLKYELPESKKLFKRDKIFFYSDFIIQTVVGKK